MVTDCGNRIYRPYINHFKCSKSEKNAYSSKWNFPLGNMIISKVFLQSQWLHEAAEDEVELPLEYGNLPKFKSSWSHTIWFTVHICLIVIYSLVGYNLGKCRLHKRLHKPPCFSSSDFIKYLNLFVYKKLMYMSKIWV